ncbi:MAG: sodium:alanine symporter family protein [candidate division Zixibacteria bacterium]|nr:sodium:alanine symporter family protein [candidate division Zixibacteria bacterium]
MELFDRFWAAAVDLTWGLPLVILLISAGAYFTIASRFLPFRGARHALQILRGIYDKKDDPGEISHFQALTSALSATLGMGNIAGVAIAVSMGGPGAIFWMWVAGLVGMSTKFFTCTLACLYRKEDENGVVQGGPMYFLEVGLGRWGKPLAVMFALCGMIGCLALFQINQLSSLLHDHWEINRLGTGIVCSTLVGVVILGGIVRVGKVTSRIVPAMFLLYFFSALFVILSNAAAVPGILASIVNAAFAGKAVVGGVAGVAFREVLITGVRRAAFSNEAGMGTAPMAHGAAKTKEPVREGLIAMLGPFFDTHIVCTMTALVILSTGVGVDADGAVMTVSVFDRAIPVIGGYIMTLVVILFSVSTMVSYSYYSVKCAIYLFGSRFGSYYVYVYIFSLIPDAIWTQDTAINILDTGFALMSIPTVVGTLLLSPRVITATKDYFRRMRL